MSECKNGFVHHDVCSCRKELESDLSRLREENTRLQRWMEANNYTKMIDDAIKYGIELGQKQVMGIIKEQVKALSENGEGKHDKSE